MARLIIRGGNTISGTHRVSGNKNAALPMIAASLLTSEPVTIANVPDGIRGQTLAEADLRKKKGITVLCIRRSDADPKKPRKIIIPQASDIIESDDKLIVFGETRQIDSLS